MTSSPDAKPRIVATLDDAADALRREGLRLSTTRRLMLEALFSAESPISAEQLAHSLGLDPASVHRNFEMLERHGLISHVHLGHSPGLYALRGRDDHEYLYCDRCGSVRTLEGGELDCMRQRIRERYGYLVRFDHFAIVGLCPGCARERA